MKTLSMLLTLLLISVMGLWAQDTSHIGNAASGRTRQRDSSNNNIFILDVGTPNASSFKGSLSKLKLQMNTSDVVSIQLKHCNPFKYKYKLHATPVDLFADVPNITDTFTKSNVVSPSSTKVDGGNVSDVKAAVVNKLVSDTIAKVSTSHAADTGGDNTAPDANSASNIASTTAVALSSNDLKKAKVLIDNISKASSLKGIELIINNEADKANSQAFANLVTGAKEKLNDAYSVSSSLLDFDKSIAKNFRKADSVTKAVTTNSASQNDPVAIETALTPISSENLSIVTDTLSDNSTYRERIAAIWGKILTGMDINLCQMQGIQEKMVTYNMLIKTIDNFDKDIFKRYREGFRNSMSLVISDYNKMINDFNSRTITDTLGKFKIFQAKAAQFVAVKNECDKLLNQFYAVNLNNYLLPLDVNGKNIDMVDFKLERWDPVNPIKIDEYDYQIWIKGGFKFDLSAGGFLTSLMDDAFITQDVQDNGVTKKKILTDPAGSFKLGFGTMVNMSYRTGRSWVKPGLSLGIVFTTSESFQILTVPSMVLGKMERAILHFGLAIGNVSRLRPEYKVNEAYDFGSTNTVPTAKVFKAGYFFGLTYNLTKVKSNSVDAAK